MKNVIRVGQILVGLIVVAGIVLLMARPSPRTGDGQRSERRDSRP